MERRRKVGTLVRPARRPPCSETNIRGERPNGAHRIRGVHEHGGAVVEGVLVHCFDGKQLVLAFISRTALADYFQLPPLHEEPRQSFTAAMQPPRGE